MNRSSTVRLLASLVLSALSGWVLPAIGQDMDWRPFRSGCVHYLTAGAQQDSVLSYSVGGGYVLPSGDSVYVIGPIIARTQPADSLLGCDGWLAPAYVFPYRYYADTEFGARLWVRPGGVYEFTFADSSTFEIRTRGAVGTSWACTPAITGTIQGRTVVPLIVNGQGLFGQDSLLTISLSNGEIISITKRSGLWAAPSVQGLLGQGPVTPLQFCALPARGIGLPPNHPWRVYDWQPGDEFAYYGEYEGTFWGGPIDCRRSWRRIRVLSRALSGNEDTLCISYEEQERDSVISPGLCNGTGTVPYATLWPRQTRVLRLPRTGVQPDYALPSRAARISVFYSAQNVGIYRSAFVPGCPNSAFVTRIKHLAYDTCARAFTYSLDVGHSEQVAEGLGDVVTSIFAMGSQSGEHLIWYLKNGQTCGSLAGFPNSVLADPAPLPEAAVRLWPNPATTSARLLLTELPAGPLTITVTDALGRRIWSHQQDHATDGDLTLPTAEWPRGVYQVRVQTGGGARTLRLVRE